MHVVARQMFNSDQGIADFFGSLGGEAISVNIVALGCVARSCQNLA